MTYKKLNLTSRIGVLYNVVQHWPVDCHTLLCTSSYIHAYTTQCFLLHFVNVNGC